MGTKVYLHEVVDITRINRANYFNHMTTEWAPAMKDRKQKLVGLWGTLGSTGNWPEVINLWEYASWQEIGENFDLETADTATMQDPFFRNWNQRAYELRHHGFDRILVPSDYTPSIDQIIAMGRLGHRVYYHDRITLQTGQSRRYLDLLGKEWLPVANGMGMELIGAYRTTGRNDSEAVVIWAVRDWGTWAKIEEALDGGSKHVTDWRRKTADIVKDWSHEAMCAAPNAPCRTGKHLADL